MITCKHCKTNFTKKGQNNTFCSKLCYKAHYKEDEAKYRVKYDKEHPAKLLIKQAKSRSKLKKIEFDLKEIDISLPTHCPILGIELQVNRGNGAGGKDNSYSLDRIDPNKGYIKGNIQVISHKANSMKFSATKEELLKFADWIISEYRK